MSVRKEIVVLSGGGHKGIAKIQWQDSDDKMAQCTCNLDFRPRNATLYLVGDNVAKMQLDDINTSNEVSFCAKSDFGCVLRSSSLTMFGGSLNKGLMTRKVDEFLHANDGHEQIENSACDCKNSVVHEDKNESGDKDETALIESECDSRSTQKYSDVDKIGGDVFSTQDNTKFGLQFDEWTRYDGNNFYLAVKPQIDEIFVCYPADAQLNDLVGNSQWVRVQTDDDFYVVGLLYDGKEPAYICYGVPSKSCVNPPAELENVCVWLPLSQENGYWVIYQSAKTGEIVKIK